MPRNRPTLPTEAPAANRLPDPIDPPCPAHTSPRPPTASRPRRPVVPLAEWVKLRSSTRVTLYVGLNAAMGLFVLVYAVALVLRDARLIPVGIGWFNLVVDDWLEFLIMWGSAAVCWLGVWRVGFRRLEVFLASVAVTSFAAGDTYYLAMVPSNGALPFPSPADVGYLLFYPLMLAALALAVHRNVRGLALSVWLDSAVGSFGAASMLAVVLSPVLASAITGSRSLAMLIAVAYPMFDLLLVAAVAGIAALGVMRLGGRWGLLVVGLVVFAAADVVYALQVGANTYVVGTPLDASWAVGLALIALCVGGATRRDGSATQQTRAATGATTLVVPAVATAAGLAVLVVSSRAHVSNLAVTLAGVTLLGAGVRTQLAFGELRSTQSQLVDAARNAGRAEIAINVLHNVGNVLNSVNVSASLVAQKVRGSKSTGLVKVVALLDEHAGDLGDFFTTDARGKALPGYLEKLTAVLAIERASVEEELLRLTNGVDHIKEIVSAQQSLAGVSSVIESVRVSEVMDVALRMAGVFADSEVTVVRNVPDDLLLALDRHRVLLVLLNLIENALHAMKWNGDRPPHLSLTAKVTAGQGVSITVTDNGEGIPPGDLTRIFVHGFTTHVDGHGFGLHSSAMAAKEMGGALTAFSEGTNTGAVFTLAMPLQSLDVVA